MNDGAQTLERGATSFSKAGENVTNAMTSTSAVALKMVEISGALTSSSSALQAVVADYRSNREATGSMLSELKSVVESAKRETAMTDEILVRIQAATDKLVAAQREADTYLDGVSDLLAGAHQSFSEGLTRTLDRANEDFHIKLSNAVGLLTDSIGNLDIALSNAPADRV